MQIYKITPQDNCYPKNLLDIKQKPKQLYVTGNLELLNKKCIAIVGSRTNTEYGAIYTRKFAQTLSKCGITIISGLALGIDSIAHRNSMDNIGRTIAVLGSGFNNIYPEQNEELFNQIVRKGGCAISEYDPDIKADLSKFPRRNRIIAGLSQGVLVIEAKNNSGSIVTARRAFEQNKPVFCLPNQIGNVTGNGTNNLIKQGAKLVTNEIEILREIEEDVSEALIFKDDIEIEEISSKQIDEKYREIYEVLNERTN